MFVPFTFGEIMKEYYVYIMASIRNGTLYTLSLLLSAFWGIRNMEIKAISEPFEWAKQNFSKFKYNQYSFE